MMCARFCDAGDAIASSAAKVGVVTFRMNNPIIPSDGGEVDVERIATTFTRARPAVDTSRLSINGSLRKRVDHDERFAIVVHRDRKIPRATSFAGDLNCVCQVVILHPILHRPRNVDLLPRLIALIDFSYRQRLRFRKVKIGPPVADLR